MQELDIGGTGAGQTTAAWRIPLGLQLIPGVVLCVGACFLPFSPRWLMLRGKYTPRGFIQNPHIAHNLIRS